MTKRALFFICFTCLIASNVYAQQSKYFVVFYSYSSELILQNGKVVLPKKGDIEILEINADSVNLDLERKVLTVLTRRLHHLSMKDGEESWKFIDLYGKVQLPLSIDSWLTLRIRETEPNGSIYDTFYSKVKPDFPDWKWEVVYPRTKVK